MKKRMQVIAVACVITLASSNAFAVNGVEVGAGMALKYGGIIAGGVIGSVPLIIGGFVVGSAVIIHGVVSP